MFSVGTGRYTVVWLGAVQWLPSYFTRSFDMSLTQVGFWLALVRGWAGPFRWCVLVSSDAALVPFGEARSREATLGLAFHP